MELCPQRLELSPEAQKFFGLSDDPFSRPPRHKDEVFISPPLQKIIDRVIDGVASAVTSVDDAVEGLRIAEAIIKSAESGPVVTRRRPEGNDEKCMNPLFPHQLFAETVISYRLNAKKRR